MNSRPSAALLMATLLSFGTGLAPSMAAPEPLIETSLHGPVHRAATSTPRDPVFRANVLNLGAGMRPGVAVDAAGTAYIAWHQDAGSLQFCRLPRGSASCSSRHAIVAPGSTTSRAFVVVTGARVVVVQRRYGGDVPGFSRLYAFTSPDAGNTFAPGQIVGSVNFNESVPGPGDTLSGMPDADAIGGAYQNVPLDGSPASPDAFAQLWPANTYVYNGTVALVDAATPIALSQDLQGHTQFRRYDGSGSLNDAANWTPAVDLGVMQGPKLVGGPSGLFLFASTDVIPKTSYVRKWNGTTFGPRVTVAGGTEPPLDAFQDAAGRLHVAFARGRGPITQAHAVSDDGKIWHWGPVTVQSVGAVVDTRIATAPDHVGVIVWRAGEPGQIRIASVGPSAPKNTPKITVSGRAQRRAGDRVLVDVQGKILLPSGFTRAVDCRGTVRVTVSRGTQKLTSKQVALTSNCTYKASASLTRSQVKTASKLRATASFSGNTVLRGVRRSDSFTITR